MPELHKYETAVAICVQEITEDGSNLTLGERFDERQLSLLSQAFTADTLVSALSAPDVAVRLFFGDDPATVSSVAKIVDYLRSRLEKGNGSLLDSDRFAEVELPANRWGIKMEEAMAACFAEGFKKVIFLGSRSPTVTVSLIKQAIQELDTHDAVFGPTVEGRYYLMGMKGDLHTSLSQFNWRTPEIYSDVSSALTSEGHNWSELPMWYVVEHPEDLEYLVRDINQFRMEGDEITAHETERALERFLAEGQ
ncbi:MAG: DUF2064 domain-containing protein [Candidatus Zixiibacteriota bacterium]